MSRNGLTKDIILQTATQIIDKDGKENLSLKVLAEKLGVRSPSLYNHFNSLSDLYSSLMLYGWKQLEHIVIQAAIGKAKDDAIKSMCEAYLDYAMQHIGLFEIMQSYSKYTSTEAENATKGLVETIKQVLSAYKLSEENKVHTIRLFRSFLQGYVSLVSFDSFGEMVSIKKSFEIAISVLLKGLTLLETNETRGA